MANGNRAAMVAAFKDMAKEFNYIFDCSRGEKYKIDSLLLEQRIDYEFD